MAGADSATLAIKHPQLTLPSLLYIRRKRSHCSGACGSRSLHRLRLVIVVAATFGIGGLWCSKSLLETGSERMLAGIFIQLGFRRPPELLPASFLRLSPRERAAAAEEGLLENFDQAPGELRETMRRTIIEALTNSPPRLQQELREAVMGKRLFQFKGFPRETECFFMCYAPETEKSKKRSTVWNRNAALGFEMFCKDHVPEVAIDLASGSEWSPRVWMAHELESISAAVGSRTTYAKRYTYRQAAVPPDRTGWALYRVDCSAASESTKKVGEFWWSAVYLGDQGMSEQKAWATGLVAGQHVVAGDLAGVQKALERIRRSGDARSCIQVDGEDAAELLRGACTHPTLKTKPYEAMACRQCLDTLKAVLAEGHEVRIEHIFRDLNSAADRLAKTARFTRTTGEFGEWA
eukprot:CAMPEP_0204126296 /NCGR_PEP_ID=MMETSP0361-20130328/10918_1 /ASSEMBLY_ACC=CAM_ASM_000343 /TAXON_ID=268821 /ORGANISM="Scrippsiella Hangoei, Strain SHTV-5" /LENGTH=406 /DNA_ID=CAMNT_0051078139 /DNA_START=43 /DNA_END=1259 /DNA_ORIENTATION=+